MKVNLTSVVSISIIILMRNPVSDIDIPYLPASLGKEPKADIRSSYLLLCNVGNRFSRRSSGYPRRHSLVSEDCNLSFS